MTIFVINAGKYRCPITIQQRDTVVDSYGESSETWVDFFKCRAGVFPVSGKEFFSAEAINSEVTHKILLRYYPGIKPNMQVKFNNRIFQITSVINFQERNKELQLMCKELV